jgi:hypothetical protein
MQPILGFDGWGLNKGENPTLVLVEVKGTDEEKRPPSESENLIEECSDITEDKNKLARAITSILRLLKTDSNFYLELSEMLAEMGKSNMPSIVAAPVIVRGKVESTKEDLTEILENTTNFQPAECSTMSVSVGKELAQVGDIVMDVAKDGGNDGR